MWLGSALAADVVVYAEGSGPDAVALVAEATGIPAADLRPVAFPALIAERPTTVLGGQTSPCSGSPSTNTQVREAVAAVSGSVAYMDYEQAQRDASAAVATLGCLSEPIDSQLAAQVFVQSGLAASYSGDGAGASRAFRQAHLLFPGLPWDDRYGPAARAAFDQALLDVGATGVPFTVVPPPGRLAITLDGRRVVEGATILPGEHLVQVDGQNTLRIAVNSGATEVKLVWPAAVPPTALGWVEEPASQADLSGVLGALLGAGVPVYVVNGGAAWRVTSGSADWKLLAPAVVEKPRDARGLRWSLVGPGLGVAVVGAVGAGLMYGSAADARDEAAAAAQESDWTAANGRYTRSRGLAYTSLGVIGVGVGLVGVGLVF